MEGHDRLLTAFLAGQLDPAQARQWDDHLLACERCWQAVREDRAGRQAAQLLRGPPPPGLADRVAFAVELAATARPTFQRRSRQPARPRPRLRRSVRHGGGLYWRLAGAAMLAGGVVVTLLMTLLAGSHQADQMPEAVAAVARYAQAIPPPAGDRLPQHAAPIEVGRPVTVNAGGQRIVLRTWRLGDAEAVVAVSTRPFPVPARAHDVPGKGMAWSAQLGQLRLYCLNGHTSELVAGPVTVARLAALAARLPPA
jgi:anti-sigma factor RsiW